jgi:hypothetical protein
MSLCIAAHSNDDYGKDFEKEVVEDCVILCHDFKIQTPTARAQTGYKFRAVGKQWCVMMAGVVSLASELADPYAAEFATENTQESPVPILERLREPINRFRKRIADQFIHRGFAISHEEFLAGAKHRSW